MPYMQGKVSKKLKKKVYMRWIINCNTHTAMVYSDTVTTHVSRPRIISPSSVFKPRLKIGSAGCSGKTHKPYNQPPTGFVSM